MIRFGMMTLAVLVTAGPTSGHEIKILTSRSTVPEPTGRTTVYLSWGHRLPVDDLIPAETLDRYEVRTPTGKTVGLTAEGRSLQANVVELTESGVHRAIVARKPSVLTYVIDEDGERQLRRGSKASITDEKVDRSFRSTQCATALIVVGEVDSEPVQAARLPVEIVPVDPPVAWKQGKPIRFRVLVEGKPVADAAVTARTLGFKPDDAWNITTTANQDGIVTLTPDQRGLWVIKTRVERPSTGQDREEFDTETFTATLSIEIQP